MRGRAPGVCGCDAEELAMDRDPWSGWVRSSGTGNIRSKHQHGVRFEKDEKERGMYVINI